MNIKFYKYQSSGNDFILIDNRTNNIKLSNKKIKLLCNRNFGIGADGLIFLYNDEIVDFYMKYFNSNGEEGTMCGNGARAIVRFASDIKIIKNNCIFKAIDGLHKAVILENNIKIKMINVENIENYKNDLILNTGSPHYVKFIEKVNNFNVNKYGGIIRNLKEFKNGINVNFVEINDNNILYVRTYERGVEKETLSCGTGITASVIAFAYKETIINGKIEANSLGGKLFVYFEKNKNKYINIWLEGESSFVFVGKIYI